MKKLVIAVATAVLTVAGFFTLLGFLIPWASSGTSITKDEIVIERVRGFMSSVQYAVNRHNEDERVYLLTLIPFNRRHYMIEYSGSCQCIERVARAINHDYIGVHRQKDSNKFIVFKGELMSTRVPDTPFADVKEVFDEAQMLLDDVRKQYAHLIPKD